MNIFLNITLATATGGISGGLVYYFTKVYFTERIKLSIKNDYDSKLAILHGDIVRSQTVLNTVLTSQNQTFQIGQNERIEAIKILWINYISIRNSLSPIIRYDDVLYEKEFDTLFTSNWKGNDLVENAIRSLSLDELKKLINAKENIEKIRPFLNEQIWLNINYLDIFSGRIIYLYNNGGQEKKIKHWKKDNALIELIKDALTNDEYNSLISTNTASIRLFQNFIEQKIINEIHNITTGQVAADNTYNQALKINKLIKTNELNSI